MLQKDQQKILEVGFKIIRRDYVSMAIKQKTTYRYDWHHLESGFGSKAAIDRRMKELLGDSKTIED